jgi:ergothioneine biosynthesis protein EgtB
MRANPLTPAPGTLLGRYAAVRAQTLALAAPLSEADCQAQSMADASPVKWHLAHVTWFFETFVLEAFEPGFKPHHAAYRVLFNSYYNGVGEQHPRPQRGLLTRPSLAEVKAWRAAVDARMLALLDRPQPAACAELVELGLQHEQQHQELLLTDVLHLLSCNPLAPAYRAAAPSAGGGSAAALGWVHCEGGPVDIGHDGCGFAYDNEGPRHRQWLAPHALASRLVTQGEWAHFIADGGYGEPRWWLAAGWNWLREQGVHAPLYWRESAAGWQVFTLAGLQPIEPAAPVVHLSLYEADAYARWCGAQQRLPLRLPTEAEWEQAAAPRAAAALAAGHFVDSGALQPRPAQGAVDGLQQLFGDAWEWTGSAYLPYPGFRSSAGAVGEYNGKFMMNQMVLRGGSCASPREHLRASYRNFFPPEARWQFSGLRLARDPS